MKKVLFATTALVATAGVAAADVTFGGYGRFGVQYDSDVRQAGVDGVLNTADDVFDSETNVTSRFRFQIDATAESDAGVTFGARIRLQSAEGTAANSNGARFFARSGGLEVGVGNIFGAIGSMASQYPIDLGLTGLGYQYTAAAVGGGYFDEYSSGGLGASGSNGVEVMYSVGDFKAHLSASDTNDRVAGYASYTFSGYTFELGLQDSTVAADVEFTLGALATFGIADVSLTYAENGNDVGRTVLTAQFDVGAATDVGVYITDEDLAANTGYGIDFNHDMGGGTSLRGGVAKFLNGDTRADLGVRFNF